MDNENLKPYDDFLYAIFAYGMANCLLDNPEFKIFTAMMINEGKIEKNSFIRHLLVI